ncbi:hypothetical protein MP228_000142 [Amoeboaphelidium protococcarum]|nr:hypothetical protein MP228_000142 [Amoeboaphelidium protococcarum]
MQIVERKLTLGDLTNLKNATLSEILRSLGQRRSGVKTVLAFRIYDVYQDYGSPSIRAYESCLAQNSIADLVQKLLNAQLEREKRQLDRLRQTVGNGVYRPFLPATDTDSEQSDYEPPSTPDWAPQQRPTAVQNTNPTVPLSQPASSRPVAQSSSVASAQNGTRHVINPPLSQIAVSSQQRSLASSGNSRVATTVTPQVGQAPPQISRLNPAAAPFRPPMQAASSRLQSNFTQLVNNNSSSSAGQNTMNNGLLRPATQGNNNLAQRIQQAQQQQQQQQQSSRPLYNSVASSQQKGKWQMPQQGSSINFRFLRNPLIHLKEKVVGTAQFGIGKKGPLKRCFNLDRRFIDLLLLTKDANADVKFVLLVTCHSLNEQHAWSVGQQSFVNVSYPVNAELFVNQNAVRDFKASIKSGTPADITEDVLRLVERDPKNAMVHCHLNFDKVHQTMLFNIWIGVKLTTGCLLRQIVGDEQFINLDSINLNRLSVDLAKKVFFKSQTPYPDQKQSGNGEDDDLQLLSMITLSLKDPVSLINIKYPVRGSQCNHLQCFDLSTWLLMNANNDSKTWSCLICSKTLSNPAVKLQYASVSLAVPKIDVMVDQLYFCEYTYQILNEIENVHKKSIDDVVVQIDAYGNYEIVDDSKRGPSSDDDSDNDDNAVEGQPSSKQAKSNRYSANGIIDLCDTGPTNSLAHQSDVIDLTLSDDD